MLSLGGNQLSGEIPRQLGNLTKLEWLSLAGNRLTGEIPRELGSLANVTASYLAGNEFTGCIPEGMRDVENSDLGALGILFCDELPEPPDSGNAGLLPPPPEGAGTLAPLALLALLLSACAGARRAVRGRRAPAP